MAKQKMTGLLVNGSVRAAGVTFYTKQGKTVVRSSHSVQPERRTRAQFDVRMRTRHSTALWQKMKNSDELKGLFRGEKSAYAQFMSLAFRLPVVYLTYNGDLDYASMLMPGIPVSNGTLPAVKQTLGEVNGSAALLTDLKGSAVKRGDRLVLVTAKQSFAARRTPVVYFFVRNVALDEMTEVDGKLALVGEEFADEMIGWALVHVSGDSCSPQTVVTRCTYYRQYTTEEALQAAAKSYGGLKGGLEL